MSRADRIYLLITISLAIAAIVGGVVLVLKLKQNQPMEITLSQTEPPKLSGELYIHGAVSNPGIYLVKEGDTLQTLLHNAGIEPDADLSYISLYVPRKGETSIPQKIDINRAEAWLLEALPGIGKITAQAIVDYRNKNGPFTRTEDILKVKGVSEGIFAKIKDYITVSEVSMLP